MSTNTLQIGLQNFTHYAALSCIQSLFILMILLSPLQMCSQKKKKRGNKRKAPIPEVKSTADKTNTLKTRSAEAVVDRKASGKKLLKKGASKNVDAKTKITQKQNEQRKDEQTQVEESDESDRDKPDIIPITKIKHMGNIDDVRKHKKTEMEKEVEQIKSFHEMENQKPLTAAYPKMHVKITENKCKLYETDDEMTIDDEMEEPLI